MKISTLATKHKILATKYAFVATKHKILATKYAFVATKRKTLATKYEPWQQNAKYWQQNMNCGNKNKAKQIILNFNTGSKFIIERKAIHLHESAMNIRPIITLANYHDSK